MKKEMFADDGVELTEEEYAALLSWNDQDVAFVKSDKIENGEIWRVYTADGTPLAIADSRDFAFVLARQNDLEPQSVSVFLFSFGQRPAKPVFPGRFRVFSTLPDG